MMATASYSPSRGGVDSTLSTRNSAIPATTDQVAMSMIQALTVTGGVLPG